MRPPADWTCTISVALVSARRLPSREGVKLFAADTFVGDAQGRQLWLIHQRRVGVKTQVLPDDIVIHRRRQPDRRVAIDQGQQHAGGRQTQRQPAVSADAGRRLRPVAHGFQQATKALLGILNG
jgi:hypothetical protein